MANPRDRPRKSSVPGAAPGGRGPALTAASQILSFRQLELKLEAKLILLREIRKELWAELVRGERCSDGSHI